jgi:hypothetical protein
VDDLRFRELLDAYGADVERWPAAERAAGRRRLAAEKADGSPDVRSAETLDALLARARPVEVPASLVGRVLASAEAGARRPSSKGLSPWGFSPWGLGFEPAGRAPAAASRLRVRALAAGALLVMVGMLAGWSVGHALRESAAGETLLASAYDQTTDDLFSVEGP